MSSMHPELAGAVLLEAVADNFRESEGKRNIVRTALGPIVKILRNNYSR